MKNLIVYLIIGWFLFGLWLFNPFEKISLENFEINTDQETKITLSEDFLMKPSFRNSIRKIFGMPFDLEWYNLKIIDKSFLVDYNNKSIADTYFKVMVNGKEINTQNKKEQIIYIRANKEYLVNIEFILNQTELNKISSPEYPGTFFAGLDISAKPNFWDFFAKMIVLLIALIGFYELFKNLLSHK